MWKNYENISKKNKPEKKSPLRMKKNIFPNYKMTGLNPSIGEGLLFLLRFSVLEAIKSIAVGFTPKLADGVIFWFQHMGTIKLKLII